MLLGDFTFFFYTLKSMSRFWQVTNHFGLFLSCNLNYDSFLVTIRTIKDNTWCVTEVCTFRTWILVLKEIKEMIKVRRFYWLRNRKEKVWSFQSFLSSKVKLSISFGFLFLSLEIINEYKRLSSTSLLYFCFGFPFFHRMRVCK